MAIREVPSTPFVDSLKQTLTVNYCNFEGRARRSEYWYFVLLCAIISVVCQILTSIIGDVAGMVVSGLVNLALLLPSISVTARRLHDINKSGWWQLLWLVFIVGWIILIVWLCKDSDPMPNQYGASPKYVDVE